jgi:hypothetical protein
VLAKRFVLGAVTAAVLGSAAIALAAPTSSAPPTIEGKPAYASELTCKPGSWSSDAVNFSYAWLTGAYQLATGQTWKPTPSDIGRQVRCRISAVDAAGATTNADSSAVTITTGATTLTLSVKKTQKKKLTLAGRFGPKDAFAPTFVGSSGELVAYRVEKDGLHQLFGKETRDATGTFKITAVEPFGKHTYKINFNPTEPSLWTPQSKTVKVTIKRK